jgi:hypothetical protein
VLTGKTKTNASNFRVPSEELELILAKCHGKQTAANTILIEKNFPKHFLGSLASSFIQQHKIFVRDLNILDYDHCGVVVELGKQFVYREINSGSSNGLL